MKDVGDLIDDALEELGASAPEDEVSHRVLQMLVALPPSDKSRVVNQMLSNASSVQLAHLREVLEATREQGELGQPDDAG